MNILIAGLGKGSWDVRGRQIGAALGARVTSAPTALDWEWADIAVLVKRAAFSMAHAAHQYGVPVVWDALDFWMQPSENGLTERAARQRLADAIADIKPVLTIGATKAMAQAANGMALEHHSWPGLTPAPARAHVQVVAYEGNPVYLGAWRHALERACAARGWRFVVNPRDLREADIVVAFRDGQWDGWMCREWKSGIKIGNAIAAGRPIITQESAAFREIGAPGTAISDIGELDSALDGWAPDETRAAVVERSRDLADEYDLKSIAARYATMLIAVMEPSCPAA